MDANQTSELLLSCIRKSNLNFNISESPFSLTVTRKKSFIKNKDGTVRRPQLGNLGFETFQKDSSTPFSMPDSFPNPDNKFTSSKQTWTPNPIITSQQDSSPKSYTTHQSPTIIKNKVEATKCNLTNQLQYPTISHFLEIKKSQGNNYPLSKLASHLIKIITKNTSRPSAYSRTQPAQSSIPRALTHQPARTLPPPTTSSITLPFQPAHLTQPQTSPTRSRMTPKTTSRTPQPFLTSLIKFTNLRTPKILHSSS
jgi:hypothetical protein